MSIRTTTSTIRFSRPFAIAGVADEQPPGSYTLEIDEELLQNVSFPAYRRISTMIRLPPRPDSTELERVVYFDPLELAELLASDAKIEDKAVTTPSAATTEMPRTTTRVPDRVTRWKHRWQALLSGARNCRRRDQSSPPFR
jgi:hypothetical protein